MRKPTQFGVLIFILSYIFCRIAPAQTPAFALEPTDRVTFLGNSLMEDEVQYGYLELALTTRFPNVTYRNIGWSGDNVFGEARSYVDTPPAPYQRLIQQIAGTKPTVVLLAYGGVEAQDGEAGLARFKQGLNQLLDKIDSLGASTVLLSPIPGLLPASDNVTRRNAMLETYASAIRQTATDRKKRYVDLFKPIQEASKTAVLTDDGIHLNETGYYYLATSLEKGLGLPARNPAIAIDVAKKSVESTLPTKLLNADKSAGTLQFVVEEPYLPLPAPTQDGNAIPVDNGRSVTINGLKKGFYTLRIDGMEVAAASANQWAEGVTLRQGPAFTRSAEVQELIRKKNELHFFQYRPLNQTYIIGFRSYEQGRHKKGLDEQTYIITWLEGQIAATSQPKTATYQLTPLK